MSISGTLQGLKEALSTLLLKKTDMLRDKSVTTLFELFHALETLLSAEISDRALATVPVELQHFDPEANFSSPFFQPMTTEQLAEHSKVVTSAEVRVFQVEKYEDLDWGDPWFIGYKLYRWGQEISYTLAWELVAPRLGLEGSMTPLIHLIGWRRRGYVLIQIIANIVSALI